MEEVRKRESTLEVLRRLQSQNLRSLSEKKHPVILKVEDILDNDRLERLNPPKSKILPTGKQSEAVMILNEIRDIEKQLKSGQSYFDHYYDLRKKEDKLLKFFEGTENKDSFSDEIRIKVKEIKRKLGNL
ncbi:hypothetical protein J4446_01545 [Candidatus Woesearchaeota archaeon]|nr:hypothetical protein [Candidatus Woesearchaeota archaeon]